MIDNNVLLIIFILALIILLYFGLIYYLLKQNAPIRTTVIQWVGILIFIPFVFLLSYFNKVSDTTIATLLGAFIGYLFGKTGLTEEWKSK